MENNSDYLIGLKYGIEEGERERLEQTRLGELESARDHEREAGQGIER